MTFGKYLKMKPKKINVWGAASLQILINDSCVPITHSTYKKAMGKEPKRYKRFFHSTSFSNINKIKNMEGTRQALSTSTKVSYRIVDGVETDADLLFELEGDLLYSSNYDAYSLVDPNGRRWLSITSLFRQLYGKIGEIKDKYNMHEKDLPKELYDKYIEDIITSKEYKDFLTKYSEYKKPIVSNTYNECIISNIKVKRILILEDESDFVPRRNKRLKELFNVPVITSKDWKSFVRDE